MPKIDLEKLKAQARGMWLSIFDQLGVVVPMPPGNHGPCPTCGGVDRFRLDKNSTHGNWFCNGCDPKAGDGIGLVQNALGMGFVPAIEKIASIVGNCEKDSECGYKEMSNEDKRASNIALWKSSVVLNGRTPTDKYLRSRGLLFSSNAIRHCSSCWNSELGKNVDAMVAAVQNPDDKAVSIHRTYLTPDGEKLYVKTQKMLMPRSEPIDGGAIRLFPFDDLLGIAEGIETALSCKQLFDVPTWAAVSSTIMEGWKPPKEARKIIIYADNDSNFAGQSAAFNLAKRLFKDSRIVEVLVPDIIGDFNDVLKMQR